MEKDPNDYNGLEHHVVKCMENGDNSWFPVGRALCMMENNDALPNDDIETRERRMIIQKLDELQEEFLDMRRNLTNLTATVNTTLSGESLTSSGKFANVVRLVTILRIYVTKLFS